MSGKPQKEITIKSRINDNFYLMNSSQIIVFNKNNKPIKVIRKPTDDKMICFYDMYYEGVTLIVIVAYRGDYDIKFTVDEENLIICNMSLSK